MFNTCSWESFVQISNRLSIKKTGVGSACQQVSHYYLKTHKNTFYRIPTPVFNDRTICADAKLLFAYLIYNEEMKTRYKDRTNGKKYKRGDFIPLYQNYMANAIHKSVSAIRHKYIPELISAGYIDKRLINGIKGTAQNTICEYRLLWDNINSKQRINEEND